MALFALTKPEQRAIIALMMALLLGTIAMRFRDLRSAPKPIQPNAATALPDPEEERSSPDDSR